MGQRSEDQGKDLGKDQDSAVTADLTPHTLSEKDLAKHIPVIRSYIRKILRKDEIEDGVQTVLMRAVENLDRYRGDSTPRVWLLGIARNVGYELARNRQRQPLYVESSEEAHAASGMPEATGEPNQEEMLGNRQDRALTLMALDGLSLDEKLALLITYVDNVQGPDAAELLGVTFAAFRQRLSRARQALAKELKRVTDEGAPVEQNIIAQWQSLLEPRGGPGAGGPPSSPGGTSGAAGEG
jgi:RNA polymerase sigma-70 factor (ECF subfamily)